MRIRTGYSFKAAAGHLPDVLSRLKETGHTVAPISDRQSTFGFTRWTKLAQKEGLRPIYGVEIGCVPELGEKKPTVDYWTFFALDSLRPLHDLIRIAGNNPGKEPALLYSQALAAAGVARIAGERVQLDRLGEGLPQDFYLALAPSTPIGLARRAAKLGIPFLAACDNYYPREDDLEFYRVALGRRGGTQTYPRHIMADAELREWLAEEGHSSDLIAQAFTNRDRAMERCRATMKTAKLLVPKKDKTLREMCQDGAAALSIDLTDDVYRARLERELAVIKEKEYEDYFYILADMIAWAKQRMVVGPARGSSCGSLVCYLLGITAIDPIPFGLIFERFIDINRKDLPDIDVDFSDVRRNMVFDYAEERYGRDRVARLGTVGMFKARSALKQTGAVLRIPQWRTDKVSDSIIVRSSGDSRAMNTLEDTLNETDAGRAILKDHPEIKVAALLEGHPAGSSQHAAGVVITDEPVAEYVAVDPRTKACWADKKDAEALNLLKIDALGLTQLSVFERTLELLGRPSVSGYLETLPLDDPAAFAVLNSGRFSGIFQFTGTALRQLAGQITFDKIDDIIAMTALARPGPLASGGAHQWIKRRMGEPWGAGESIHPLLAELTKETYGVVLYQETVMRITREIGKFSWEDTSTIRKLMSARMGDEFFAKFGDKFKTGAQENGLSLEQATILWDQINTFGSWAFNKAHAVAYGMVSYWCAWLKAHHPVEFAAATLDAEPDPAKQIALLRELAAEGVRYRAIDPERSIDRWMPTEDGMLVGPLTSIKGIGPAKVAQVLEARRNGTQLKPGLQKQLENARTDIDSLFPIQDRIRALHPALSAINIFSEPRPIINVQTTGRNYEVMIFGLITRVSPKDANEPAEVMKRGGREMSGPTLSLNLFVRDDTDEMFCKIDRFDYRLMMADGKTTWGQKIIGEARAGKSLYAIKGIVPSDFRMIKVKAMRYLGEVE